MHPFYTVQAFYYLVYTVSISLIVVSCYVMVYHARRKRLGYVLRWLIPGTVAVTLQTVSCIISDAFLFGLLERFPIFAVQSLLGVLASFSFTLAVFRLLTMVKQWPEDMWEPSSGDDGNVLWSVKNMPELAALSESERQNVIWDSSLKVYHHWQSWVSIAFCLLCIDIGDHLASVVGAALGGAIGGCVCACVVVQMQAGEIRRMLAQRKDTSAA